MVKYFKIPFLGIFRLSIIHFRKHNKIDIKEIYENGECPDCGDTIPIDVKNMDYCQNCGHVF